MSSASLEPLKHILDEIDFLLDESRGLTSLLDRLPEDCSVDDVLYHLYVVQQIEPGRAEANAGRLISHEEVAGRLRQKWVLGAAG